MKRLAVVVLAAALGAACQQAPPPAPSRALPQDPIMISVEQRQCAAIPGSGQSLFVRIGDITRGQTMLSLEDADGRVVVDARSVRDGDVVRFELGEVGHYLQVWKLHNLLLDQDVAELRLSSTVPPPLPQPEKTADEAAAGEKK